MSDVANVGSGQTAADVQFSFSTKMVKDSAEQQAQDLSKLLDSAVKDDGLGKKIDLFA